MSKNKEKSKTEDLKQQIEHVKKERDEYLQGWQRAKADLINFKRETAQAVEKNGEYAKRSLVAALIPALEAFEESSKSDIEGLSEIYTLLLKGLQEEGVHIIEPKEGDSLDPRMHESVEGEGATIKSVLRRGYALNGITIKPAVVTVKE